MGAEKAYKSAKRLGAALDDYFRSIRRVVPVTEMVPTGERDDMGHMIYEPHEVTNEKGETMMRRDYMQPPSVGGACVHIGISRRTWARYRKDPRLGQEIERAWDEMLRWNEEQMLVREGKNVKGIQFNLEQNFYKTEVETERSASGVVLLPAVEEHDDG